MKAGSGSFLFGVFCSILDGKVMKEDVATHAVQRHVNTFQVYGVSFEQADSHFERL